MIGGSLYYTKSENPDANPDVFTELLHALRVDFVEEGAKAENGGRIEHGFKIVT